MKFNCLKKHCIEKKWLEFKHVIPYGKSANQTSTQELCLHGSIRHLSPSLNSSKQIGHTLFFVVKSNIRFLIFVFNPLLLLLLLLMLILCITWAPPALCCCWFLALLSTNTWLALLLLLLCLTLTICPASPDYLGKINIPR